MSQILFNNFCVVSLKKKKTHPTAKNQLFKETPDFISFLLLTDHAICFQRVHQFVVFFFLECSLRHPTICRRWSDRFFHACPCPVALTGEIVPAQLLHCAVVVLPLPLGWPQTGGPPVSASGVWGPQNYTPLLAFSFPRHWRRFHWIAADVLAGRWGAVQLMLFQNSSFTNGTVWVVQDQRKNGESDENTLF